MALARPPFRDPLPQAATVNSSVTPLPRRAPAQALLPNLHAGPPHPQPCEGESELPRGCTWWEGLELQPSREPCCAGDLCKGGDYADRHAVARQGLHFPATDIGTGVPRLLRPQGTCLLPHALLWTRRAAGDRAGLSLRGPALPAAPRPQRVWSGGSREQGGPGRGAANSALAGPRAPSPPPARPGPRLTRLAEAGSRRRCSAGGSALPGQPPAGGRQLHAAASSARPAPPLPHTFHRK